MDDLLITVTHPDRSYAANLMQQCINKISHWTSENGFKFSAPKTVAINFSRNPIYLEPPRLYLNETEIEYSDEIKFLGLIFDKKLTFESHVKLLKAKCLKCLNLLRAVGSQHWGADQESIMRFYRAIIRSRLDYGSVVYNSASPTTLKTLEPVANEAMRIASGCFKTTPIESLQNICGEPALQSRRDRLTLRYYFKIRS